MDKHLIEQIIRQNSFSIDEAGFASVGSWWRKEYTAFYTHFRLYYVTDGTARMQLVDKWLTLRAGYIYFIPEHSVISSECPDEMSHYYIHFRVNTEALHANADAAGLFSLILFERELPAMPLAESLYKLVIAHAGRDSLHDRFTALGAFQILLAPFFHHSTVVSGRAPRFASTLAYINAHVYDPLTVKQLAQRNHLNVVYFSNLFAKTVGVSPLQYILAKKISCAISLLFHTDMSVQEIAYTLNFTNEFYFSRLFKQKLGVSPREFRKQITQGDD